ncbi:MAG: DNA polymerase III subunit gamma/tau [Guyparkeria sp.]|uniref:DNA polymerase III subunit gamma/tau n=1 Tax=Guyparkeria sp. TaxID=2035736 RepID=UPI00397A31F3
MSYLVLARKWRPKRFDEMVGQGHVLQALTNALDRDRLHHAYLFTGTRGVGKTTVARIFAKALNCERGVSSRPCGECDACREIDSGRFVDLIEVDAASRTKVDDTRELLDNVVYLPVKGRFKIYLIDEVHMFSAASFNALLKTLEEPPEHVKFLLATTDPQKLPVTVLSRCLQFNLRALPQQHIQRYLGDILEKEGIESDAESLRLVSESAGGSIRDALSLLDQAIGYCDGRLDAEAVADMLGVTDRRLLESLLHALAAGDADALFALVDQALERSVDPARLLAELAESVHRASLAQWLPPGDSTEPGAKAPDVDPQTLQLWYQIALGGRRDIGWAPSARVGLEMTLLRMLAFQPVDRPASAPAPVGNVADAGAAPAYRLAERARPEPGPETRPEASPAVDVAARWSTPPAEPNVPDRTVPDASRSPAGSDNPAGPSADPGVASASAGEVDSPRAFDPDRWPELVSRLPMPARSLAERCHASLDSDTVVLTIDPGFRSMASKSTQDRLVTQLKRLGVTQPVRFVFGSPVERRAEAAPAPRAPAVDGPTPAEIREQNERAARDAREQSVRSHPSARVLTERAGAELLPDSVRPVEQGEHANEQQPAGDRR